MSKGEKWLLAVIVVGLATWSLQFAKRVFPTPEAQE